ncbi:MAG: hypothetical protein U5N53_07350 [Mycobacterium sp.]|nr:hypothetical protein [Mycobacterium sp.]
MTLRVANLQKRGSKWQRFFGNLHLVLAAGLVAAILVNRHRLSTRLGPGADAKSVAE